MSSAQLICEPGADRERFLYCRQHWQLHSDPAAVLALVFTPQRLELRKLNEPRLGAVWVDFVAGTLAHRRRFGGGRGEALARAVGIKGEYLPQVLDATAGLGRDAFVLASVGCRVQMVERHPVVAALLEDGLRRGYQDLEIGGWLRERLTLLPIASLSQLMDLPDKPEVVYLDPMFPHRRKSALVKKEMRIFQQLVGCDADAAQLLRPARQMATRRVVVKRPDYAAPLGDEVPQGAINSKNHRFDLYASLAGQS